MNITVFGANGRVGRIVVDNLLASGHSVTAFVHGATPFVKHESLTILQGDIYDNSSVDEALQNADAVMSTLGSWGTANKDILTRGMENIIPCMKKRGVERIISLTGHDAWAAGDDIGLVSRVSHGVLGIVAPKILRDGEAHIALLEKSGLNWTVIRSPIMNEAGSDSYSLGTKRPTPWATIHRRAVAQAQCDSLVSGEFSKKSPFIERL